MATRMTQQKIEVMRYEEVPVFMECELLGTVLGFPNDKRDTNFHDHYKISVIVGENTESFDFYGSYSDYQKQNLMNGKESMLEALDCFIGDALSGLMSFDEFCGEYGYDEDSRSAERIHNATKESTIKASRLGWMENDLYNISSIIRYRDEKEVI